MFDSVLGDFDSPKARRVIAQGITHGSGGDHLDVFVIYVVAFVPVTGEHR